MAFRSYTLLLYTCIYIYIHVLLPSPRSRIRRHNLHFNGDAKTLLTVVGIIEDIAVDWTTGNVYFTVNTMSTDSYIAVIDKDGHHRTTLVTGIGKPRGIALHPVLK